MKALFLGLLALNLLFLAWSQWHAPARPPPASIPQGTAAPTLQLANEASNVVPAEENSSTAPMTVPSSQVAANDSAPAAPGTNELLNDIGRCISLGPFRDLAEAGQASSTMRGAGYSPRTRVAEGDVWAGLWVYLADLPSRAEAQRAMTLLKQRGVADAYIMPASDQTNVISLGIFTEPPRAQRRAEEVRALGFTPSIADRTRRDTVYWIDIDLKPTDSMISPADIQGESGRIVRLEVKACPSNSAH